jgi:hypothetical protein
MRTRLFARLLAALVIPFVGALSFGCRTDIQPAPSRSVTTIEADGRVTRLLVRGRWLVWNYFIPSPAPAQLGSEQVGVYDLTEERRVAAPPAANVAVWLQGDDLYYDAFDEAAGAYRLYVTNLLTGETQKLPRPIPGFQANIFNAESFFWQETYPELCQKITECGENLINRCGEQIMRQSVNATQPMSLGVFDRNVTIAAVSSDLLVLSGEMARCDIKASSGPIRAVDLRTGQVWLLSQGTVSGGVMVYLVAVYDRTVAYALSPAWATRVVEVLPGQTPQLLLDTRGIQPVGLAGPDVLVFVPNQSTLLVSQGLIAYHVRTGQHQVLDTNTPVHVMSGDGQHVAWVIGDSQIKVSRLMLAEGGTPLALPPGRPDWRLTEFKPVEWPTLPPLLTFTPSP